MINDSEQKAIENIEKELNKKYEVVPLYKDFSINSPMNIVQKHYNDTDIKIILNLISKLQADIEIKDKMIDELINFLLNYDIDEDYCKKIERQECNKYKEGYCDKCIKQHFYEQVEKVGGEDE